MLNPFFAKESYYFAEKYSNADKVMAFYLSPTTATGAYLFDNMNHHWILFLVFIQSVTNQDIQRPKDNKRGLRQRRLWATHVNQKWVVFSFQHVMMLPKLVFPSVYSLIETICPALILQYYLCNQENHLKWDFPRILFTR